MNEHEGGRKRSAPCYQEYAADWLADRGFRSMSAVERGVLYTLRLETWVNGSVPADPAALARVLGLDLAEVQAGLTQRVLRYFRAEEGVEPVLTCPELEDYRRHLNERHAKLSDAGRRGAGVTNQVRRDRVARPDVSQPDGLPDGYHAGDPDGLPASQQRGHPDGPLSRAEQSTAEQNLAYRDDADPFLKELEGPSEFEQAAAARLRARGAA